eukprot:m.49688 g.49688  ORF g.49688 m.49688 type:complete len:436 (-) comp12094_c0_seq1:92-1399(-)
MVAPDVPVGREWCARGLTCRDQQQSFVLAGHRFDLPPVLRPVAIVGRGSHGAVAISGPLLGPKDAADPSPSASPSSAIAIKQLVGPFRSIGQARRLVAEVACLSRLKHPHIAVLCAVLCAPRCAEVYLCMPAADGDLQALVASNPPWFGCQQRVACTAQLFDALAYLHDTAAVCHRDICPRNLLVNTTTAMATRKLPHLCITDFGLAAPISSDDRHQDEQDNVVGTVWYRAPELFHPAQMSRPCAAEDLWSAGCVVAELLTGRPLFPGTEATQLATISTAQRAEQWWAGLVPCANASDWAGASDLIKLLVATSPADRPAASVALRHPCLTPEHGTKKAADADTGGDGGSRARVCRAMRPFGQCSTVEACRALFFELASSDFHLPGCAWLAAVRKDEGKHVTLADAAKPNAGTGTNPAGSQAASPQLFRAHPPDDG